MWSRLAGFFLAIALTACTGTPPPRAYSPCATEPGGWDCEIERYQNAR